MFMLGVCCWHQGYSSLEPSTFGWSDKCHPNHFTWGIEYLRPRRPIVLGFRGSLGALGEGRAGSWLWHGPACLDCPLLQPCLWL